MGLGLYTMVCQKCIPGPQKHTWRWLAMLHFPWCQLWLEVIIPSSCSPSLLCFAIFATMLMCFWDCTAGQVSAVALTHIALGDLVFSSLPKTGVSAQLKTEVCGMRLKLAMAGGGGGWLSSPPERWCGVAISGLAGRLQPPATALTSY